MSRVISFTFILAVICGFFAPINASIAQDKEQKTDAKADSKSGETGETAESAKPDDKPEVPADFATILKEWQDLEKEFTSMEAEYEAAVADPAKREEIKTKHSELIKKSDEIAPKLQTAALKEYKAKPNADEDLTRLLVGMLVHNITMANSSDALNIAKTLYEGKCDEKHFDAVQNATRIDADDLGLIDEITALRKEFIANDLPRVKLTTSKGEVIVELFEDHAPNTVANFVSLVEKKFYDGLTFHRVIDQFVAQGGDPNADGSGGPGYTIKCECTKPDARRHYEGYLSMAHGGKDSGGSQFFIIYTRERTQHLDQVHTVFGRVVSGMENVKKFQPTSALDGAAGAEPDKIVKAEVLRKREHEYKPEVKPDEKPPGETADDKKADDKKTDDKKADDKKADDKKADDKKADDKKADDKKADEKAEDKK